MLLANNFELKTDLVWLICSISNVHVLTTDWLPCGSTPCQKDILSWSSWYSWFALHSQSSLELQVWFILVSILISIHILDKREWEVSEVLFAIFFPQNYFQWVLPWRKSHGFSHVVTFLFRFSLVLLTKKHWGKTFKLSWIDAVKSKTYFPCGSWYYKTLDSSSHATFLSILHPILF